MYNICKTVEGKIFKIYIQCVKRRYTFFGAGGGGYCRHLGVISSPKVYLLIEFLSLYNKMDGGIVTLRDIDLDFVFTFRMFYRRRH